MIFQVYYSLGVVFISFIIWAANNSGYFTFSAAWGCIFAALWVGSQLCACECVVERRTSKRKERGRDKRDVCSPLKPFPPPPLPTHTLTLLS